jgi:hypothetical protein
MSAFEMYFSWIMVCVFATAFLVAVVALCAGLGGLWLAFWWPRFRRAIAPAAPAVNIIEMQIASRRRRLNIR